MIKLCRIITNYFMENIKYSISRIFLIVFLTFSWNILFSQSETDSLKLEQIVVIKMENGDEYKGTISKKDGKTIVLKTVNGEISLIATSVRSIENYDYEGIFEFPNPHDTRYFFGPSGIPIKKGKTKIFPFFIDHL